MNEPSFLHDNKRNSTVYACSMTAVMAAVTCVLAPMSIPIGPVPISLTNLAIYIALYLLGWKLGTLSCVVYLLIGILGVPVFSGFTGGLGKLLGPTGGYIIGFLPMAVIGGLFLKRFQHRGLHCFGLALGTIVCYLLGTAWFCFSMKTSVAAALGQAVFPFIPFDAAKIVLAAGIGPLLRGRLLQAGLLRA